MEELNNQNQPEENKANPEPIIDSGFQKMLKITSNIEAARREMRKYVIGQDEMIDLMMIGVLSGGHILLEGVPGIAKTLTAKALARTLSVHFARIQFTPDMMPSDIIGTSVFNQKSGEFSFKRGPVFTNIVLIDEINRAPAKTQSALFEVMEERQITYDGITYEMEYPFLVLATQNPIEQEGTYRLPEAQLDRFLFRVKLTYPKPAEERDILSRYKDEIKSPDLKDIAPIFNPTNLKEFQELIKQVKVEDQLIKYIAEIVTNTREHGRLYLGASPRASLALLKSSKALAAMRGRDFIIPDDVQFLAYHVLNHRIILSPEAEMEGVTTEDVIKEIIQKIEVPR
jgi:MoxR-like ATPase